MHTKEWTKEPWTTDKKSIIARIYGPDIGFRGGDTVAELGGDKDKVNAARIVSCVNALSGLDPEAIAGLVEAATEIYDHAKKYGAAPFSAEKMFARLEHALTALKGGK